MSDRVERKILDLLDDRRQSPYGNPIPGLAELGVPPEHEMRSVVVPLAELAGVGECRVEVRRVGEPIQQDPRLLSLLQDVGVVPGRGVDVSAGDQCWRIGGPETAVEISREVAGQVWVTLPRWYGEL